MNILFLYLNIVFTDYLNKLLISSTDLNSGVTLNKFLKILHFKFNLVSIYLNPFKSVSIKTAKSIVVSLFSLSSHIVG